MLAAVAMAVAGCGAVASQHHSPAVSANLLGASNTAALGTSFSASFTGGVSVNLAGVKGLPSTMQQQLTKAASLLNGATLKGTLEFQSSGSAELTYTMPPLLSETVTVLEVGGAGYYSLNGTQWYSGAPAGGTGSGQLPTGLSKLRSQLQQLSSELSSAAKVTDLGSGGQINGVETEHLEAVISGSGLDGILSNAISQLGSGGGSPGAAGLGGLGALTTFGQTRIDSWVATTSHLPQKMTASSSLTVDLGALSLLAPGSAPTVSGSAAFGLSFSAEFGRYGANFGLSKPAQVLPGAPTMPASPLSLFA